MSVFVYVISHLERFTGSTSSCEFTIGSPFPHTGDQVSFHRVEPLLLIGALVVVDEVRTFILKMVPSGDIL